MSTSSEREISDVATSANTNTISHTSTQVDVLVDERLHCPVEIKLNNKKVAKEDYRAWHVMSCVLDHVNCAAGGGVGKAKAKVLKALINGKHSAETTAKMTGGELLDTLRNDCGVDIKDTGTVMRMYRAKRMLVESLESSASSETSFVSGFEHIESFLNHVRDRNPGSIVKLEKRINKNGEECFYRCFIQLNAQVNACIIIFVIILRINIRYNFPFYGNLGYSCLQ